MENTHTTRIDEHERQIKILIEEWTKAKLEIQKIKDWVKEFTGRDLDKVFDVNIGKWVPQTTPTQKTKFCDKCGAIMINDLIMEVNGNCCENCFVKKVQYDPCKNCGDFAPIIFNGNCEKCTVIWEP